MKLMKIREASEYLGIPVETLRYYVKNNEITYYQRRKWADINFDKKDLDKFIQKQKNEKKA